MAFIGGGALCMGIERVIGSIWRRLGAGEQSSGPSAIFTGVSLDLFSDGIMIGTTTILDPSLGLLLALGQVPADLPEGFAAIATLRAAGIARRTRILMALSFALPILIGADLGLLRPAPGPGDPDPVRAGGHRWDLTSVVVEEVLTEAYEGATNVWGPILLTGSFAVFALISVYVGS